MRTLKPLNLSGLTDIRLRTWLLQLSKQVAQTGNGTISPVTVVGGNTLITNIGLQFTNDLVYGALLNQNAGWSRNRISFRPWTSTSPLVIDVAATKRAYPFVVLSQSHGFVAQDAQAVSHFWQFRVSPQGIPFCEDVGEVAANPLLRL